MTHVVEDFKLEFFAFFAQGLRLSACFSVSSNALKYFFIGKNARVWRFLREQDRGVLNAYWLRWFFAQYMFMPKVFCVRQK